MHSLNPYKTHSWFDNRDLSVKKQISNKKNTEIIIRHSAERQHLLAFWHPNWNVSVLYTTTIYYYLFFWHFSVPYTFNVNRFVYFSIFFLLDSLNFVCSYTIIIYYLTLFINKWKLQSLTHKSGQCYSIVSHSHGKPIENENKNSK